VNNTQRIRGTTYWQLLNKLTQVFDPSLSWVYIVIISGLVLFANCFLIFRRFFLWKIKEIFISITFTIHSPISSSISLHYTKYKYVVWFYLLITVVRFGPDLCAFMCVCLSVYDTNYVIGFLLFQRYWNERSHYCQLTTYALMVFQLLSLEMLTWIPLSNCLVFLFNTMLKWLSKSIAFLLVGSFPW